MKPPGPKLALGLSLVFFINASATTHHVDLYSANPTSPFADWSTAATNIQDAIDAAIPGDTILVTNGVYRTGGRLVSGVTTTNRVAVTSPLTVQSVNGPAVTVIEGYQVPGTTNGSTAMRCVYLTNEAALIGFTLTNGATGATLDSGGGVYFQSVPNHTTSFISNCVLTGNSAGYGGAGATGEGKLLNCSISNNWARLYGGGANGCVLVGCILKGNSAGGDGGASLGGAITNCLLIGNSAGGSGGGSYGAKLVNCTVVSNSAFGNGPFSAGGIGNSLLVANCIVYYNSASQTNSANYGDAPIFYSCTTPIATGFGVGSITNAPLFADSANADYRLQSNSPCINAGKNPYAKNSSDLDGDPRVAGGTVDIGAYEFQAPASIISYVWLQEHGFPTDGSADFADPDGDGFTNWQEWRSGTDPTNSLSFLHLFSPFFSGTNIVVSWQSVTNRTYTLELTTNLGVVLFLPLASNIAGKATATFSTNGSLPGSSVYRVRVE